MVSTASAPSAAGESLSAGLPPEDAARVSDALDFIRPLYTGKRVVTGQDMFEFAQGVVLVLSHLNTDADSRVAGILFELPLIDAKAAEGIAVRFGQEVSELVSDVRQLMRLHEITAGQHEVGKGKQAAQAAAAQLETLRKMMLAMASDMRVVLVRLASRVTTLRYFAEIKREDETTQRYASETMEVYAPLA